MKRNFKVTSLHQSSYRERSFSDRNTIQVTFEFNDKDEADKVFKEYEKLLKEDK